MIKPLWYKSIIADNIILPDNTFKKTTFHKKDVNIKSSIYNTIIEPKIKMCSNPPYDYKNNVIHHLKQLYTNIEKTTTIPQIKTNITKFYKKIDNINTVIKNISYNLLLTNNQKNIIHSWIAECRRVYNICVDKHTANNKYFNKGHKCIKASLFKEIYKGKDKPIPYDVVTDEVRVFYSNLKSCYTNLKNHNINHFTISKKQRTNTNYSLLIPRKSIYKNGIFKSIIGNIEGLCLSELPKNDCRLFYNHHSDKFILNIPINIECKSIKNRKPIVAIDPGEKKFMSFYGLESYGYIGKNMRKPILKLRDKISKYQKLLHKKDKKANNEKDKKVNKKIKNKKHIKSKIRKAYRKITNIVKELHNQSALYLCRNYDKILIPKFETQKMIKHDKSFKDYKKAFIKEGKTPIECKQKAKLFTKKTRLSKNVKYVLNALSHYKFRKHLQCKALEHGCVVKVVTEEDTSKTCTYCGKMSNEYKKRIKQCDNCNNKIDRDQNGARNILIKNINVFKYEAIKPKVTSTTTIRSMIL